MSGDCRTVFEYLVRLFQCGEDPRAPNSQEAWAYERWLWWRTVNLLRSRLRWPFVEAIAASLLERETLPSEEVKDLIQKTDDRWLKEYHSRKSEAAPFGRRVPASGDEG